MSEEKKIIELTDEDLEKVNGGVNKDSDGNYVLTRGDRYNPKLMDDYSYCYIILESKNVKNLNEKVSCIILQGINHCDSSVSVSELVNNCVFDKHYSGDLHRLFE